jgi:hypothetical protein
MGQNIIVQINSIDYRLIFRARDFYRINHFATFIQK